MNILKKRFIETLKQQGYVKLPLNDFKKRLVFVHIRADEINPIIRELQNDNLIKISKRYAIIRG